MNQKKESFYAVLVGQLVASFDYSLIFFLSPIINSYFNPYFRLHLNDVEFLILGFIFRPFLSLIWGPLGDIWGRKKLLIQFSYMMALLSVLLTLIPANSSSYNLIFLLFFVVLRGLQGAVLGNDITLGSCFLIEHSRKLERGKASGWIAFIQEAGTVLALIFAFLLFEFLPKKFVNVYGWKIPLILGAVSMWSSIYLRNQLREYKYYEKQKTSTFWQFVFHFFKTQKTNLLAIIIIAPIIGMSFYFFRIHVLTQSFSHDILQEKVLNLIFLYSSLVNGAFGFLGGIISDYVGRKPVLMSSGLCLALFCWPMLVLMGHGGEHDMILIRMIVGQTVISLFSGLYSGAFYAYLIEILPKRFRSTAASLGYNFSIPLLFGFMSFLTLKLGSKLDFAAVPGIFFSLWTIMAILVIGKFKQETNNLDLSK